MVSQSNSRLVGLFVNLSVDQMVYAHSLQNIDHRSFIFHMLIGLSEDKTPIDFVFTRSKSKITRVTFVKTMQT